MKRSVFYFFCCLLALSVGCTEEQQAKREAKEMYVDFSRSEEFLAILRLQQTSDLAKNLNMKDELDNYFNSRQIVDKKEKQKVRKDLRITLEKFIYDMSVAEAQGDSIDYDAKVRELDIPPFAQSVYVRGKDLVQGEIGKYSEQVGKIFEKYPNVKENPTILLEMMKKYQTDKLKVQQERKKNRQKEIQQQQEVQ